MIIPSPPEAAPALLLLLARGLDLVLLDPPQRRGTREVGVRAHTHAALTAVTPGDVEVRTEVSAEVSTEVSNQHRCQC